MKKLRLEDIRVDSYETHPVPQVRGTVEANMATALCATSPIKCPAPTNAGSCATNQWCC